MQNCPISRSSIFGRKSALRFRALQKFSLTAASARNIDPLRSKRSDGKSISVRHGVTLKHCSRACGRSPTSSQWTIYTPYTTQNKFLLVRNCMQYLVAVKFVSDSEIILSQENVSDQTSFIYWLIYLLRSRARTKHKVKTIKQNFFALT